MPGFSERKAFYRELREHELVEDIDYTRDGYQTLVLHLGGGGSC